jgi:energy-coupling factor transporter ATP-binding protein EcfA2
MKTISPASDSDPFRDYTKPTVFHPKFQEAYEMILALIFGPLTQNLIILVGPTGAGKTRLVKAILEQLKHLHARAVGFECFPPLQSTSPFRRFFEDYQEALADPFPNKPRNVEGIPSLAPGLFNPRSTLDTQSRVVCDRVRALNLRAVLIDEANVFADLSPAQTKFSLKLFKALANQTQVPHVLVGTDALLNFIGLDSQLQRRGRVIHLDSYSSELVEEKRGFVKLLEDLLKLSPLPANPEILHRTQSVRNLCFGAAGILVDLILDGCKLAHQRGAAELAYADLEAVAVANTHNVITDEQEAIRTYLKKCKKVPFRKKEQSCDKSKEAKKRGRPQRKHPKQYKTRDSNERSD